MTPIQLENSATPFFLIGRQGAVLWANATALGILPGLAKQDLQGLFGDHDAAAIMAITGFSEVALTRPLPNRAQTILVCEVPGSAPDDLSWLVSIVPFSPREITRLATQEFLSLVAHDLKNPLSAIFGYVDALLDTPVGEGMTAKQREVLNRIRSTSGRTLELVRNYQTLVALQSLSISVPPGGSPLNQMIRLVAEYTWRELSGAVDLRLYLAPEELPIQIGRTELERILANLFSNALRYTPRGGFVTVKTSVSNNLAECSIQNSGSVIAEEERRELFTRYRRGAASLGKPGAGLGLYIVKGLIEAARGTIDVTSSENEGTTFTFRLPLATSSFTQAASDP